MRFISVSAIVIVMSVLGIGCNKRELAIDDQGNTKIRLALNWFPDSQHGGFYAAQQAGYYEELGLAVEIIPGGPGVPLREKVTRRQVEFAIANADVILTGCKQGAPIKALMAPLQNSPRCIMVHEESGITQLDQLENVTLAMGQGKAFAEYLKSKLPLTNVRIVSYSGDVTLFVNDPKYTQQGYVFSEPFVAERKGAHPRALMVSELGFNPYTSCVFSHESLLQENPELVRKFIQATRRGWEKYIESPEKTNALILKLNPSMDAESLRYGAAAMKPLCLPNSMEPAAIGQMTVERWATLARQLEQLKLLPNDFDSSDAFTTEFLDPLHQ